MMFLIYNVNYVNTQSRCVIPSYVRRLKQEHGSTLYDQAHTGDRIMLFARNYQYLSMALSLGRAAECTGITYVSEVARCPGSKTW